MTSSKRDTSAITSFGCVFRTALAVKSTFSLHFEAPSSSRCETSNISRSSASIPRSARLSGRTGLTSHRRRFTSELTSRFDCCYNFPVRKWWVWAACLLPAAILVASTPPNNAIATSRITPELRASLTRDYEIEVVVTPHDGDAWSRLAKRVSGDGAKWEAIASFNKTGANLTSEQRVRVPFSLLRPELQRQIVTTLFPNDAPAPGGWRHTVIGSGVDGESLRKIAEWFTGDGANYSAIRKANPTQSLSTRKGDVIVVPKQLL